MPKPYPHAVALKKDHKCPKCGGSMHLPQLLPVDSIVLGACPKEGCGFTLELFWIGDNQYSSN